MTVASKKEPRLRIPRPWEVPKELVVATCHPCPIFVSNPSDPAPDASVASRTDSVPNAAAGLAELPVGDGPRAAEKPNDRASEARPEAAHGPYWLREKSEWSGAACWVRVAVE